MPQRLVKRNANLCISIALIWLVFSCLAGAIKNSSTNISWEFPIVVWGIQLLFIGCAVYFYQTEIPRLTYWVGDVHGYASVVPIGILPDILQQLTLFIPEINETDIENIMTEIHKGANGTAITIPIRFYDRPEKLRIYSDEENKFLDEDFEKDKIGLSVWTHIDLANEIQKKFDSHQFKS